MLHRKVGLLLAAALTLTPVTAGATPDEEAGTEPAAFLQVPVGALSSVVPDVVAGMRPDGAILFSNPSALGDIREPGIYFSTANWLDAFTMSAATTVVPVERLGFFNDTATTEIYTGGLKGYDATEFVVAEESYYDLAFTAGLGRRFEGLGIAVGVGATYLREHLAVEDGNAFTFSLSASYAYRSHRFDVIARDLGGRLRFEDRAYAIDERLILGYGYQFFRPWGSIGLGSQVTVSRGEMQRIDAGVSYDPNRYLTLRSGVGHSEVAIDDGGVPLTAGIGVHLGDANFDYAFTPRQYFGDTHTFSLGFTIGGVRTTQEPPPVASSPVFATSPAAPPVDAGNRAGEPSTDDGEVFLIVGGIHDRLENAQAEVRALELLQISSSAESFGEHFRVVVNRFEARDDAVEALRKLRYQGYKFAIVVEKGRF
jgi:hypothetical protein